MKFEIQKKISGGLGRATTIETKHGVIETPAFVAVGTKGTVKSLSPEQVKEAGSQVVLANTYHLYLEPGEKLVKESGGLHGFMNWQGPTITDSGGFQAFSLGVAYGNNLSKFIASDAPEAHEIKEAYDENKEKKAKITEEGVEFKSIIDGSTHFFSPEKSVQIQHDLGADIFFVLDECTSPHAPKEYLREAMERTHRWAERCLEEHQSPSLALPQGEGIGSLSPNPSPKGRGEPFGWNTANVKSFKELQEQAVAFRKNPTKAEEILWQVLRRDSIKLHFRRQHVIGHFIVDFVCLEKSLIVEVDGDIHGTQVERDEERTNFLESNGFKVLRFSNEQIFNDLKSVIGKIADVLTLSLGEGERSEGGASYQNLFGIVQGGRYEDLRVESAKAVGAMDFDGFGIGGSFVKEDMTTAVAWVNRTLPEEKPRHLLGVGEPIDLVLGVENGCDTFDCVAPTRIARNGTLYTRQGKVNILNAKYRNSLLPIEEGCGCYTCKNYTLAYLSHLFRAKEMFAASLASIHNIYFLNKLCSDMRFAILNNTFAEFKENFLSVYKLSNM